MAKKILVIDDEPIITMSCQKALQSEGFEVHTCSSGLEGVEMFNKDDYDLVIVDNKMPGIDGFEVLDKVKAKRPLQKVIVISGYNTPEQFQKAQYHGASFYLEKPFTQDELLEAVHKTIGSDD